MESPMLKLISDVNKIKVMFVKRKKKKKKTAWLLLPKNAWGRKTSH